MFVLSLLSFNDERERKKEKKLRDGIFLFRVYNPNRTKTSFFSSFFSLLLGVCVLDKFQTEIGTNINDSCQYHHDERCWYFDDFDEDDEL